MAVETRSGCAGVTNEQLDATAAGRTVHRYLEALGSYRPKPGRKRTREAIERRLAVISDAIPTVDRLCALKLIQERIDLQAELTTINAGDELADWERDFVVVAATFSDQHALSYHGWRRASVPAAVLREAGLSRSG
jgi:hypothetical protein